MKMRVCFVLWTGNIGGAERHTVALCRALRAMGDAAEIVVLGRGAPLEDVARDVRVTALGLARGRDVLLHWHELADAVAGCDVCVLPANGYLAPIVTPSSAVVVAMEHGDALNARALLSGRRRAVDRVARSVGARRIACEIAVSNVAAEALRAVPHARRVEVIHNGVELGPAPAEDAPLPEGGFTFGTLSRLVEGKGVDTAVDALARVREQGRDARLIIGGDGPLRPALQSRVAGMALGKYVQFAGWVDDVAEFWARCDAGVFASSGLRESFGLALFEALGAGATVVTQSSPLEAELMGGAAGLIVAPSAQVADIAAAMVVACESGRVSPVERARRRGWVESHFAMSACATRYHELFEELLAASRAGSEVKG